MITTSLLLKDLEVSAAHFIHTGCHTSPCQRLHGHNYYVTIEITAPVQDDGMIVDVRDLKTLISQLDHRTLIPACCVTNENLTGSVEFTNPVTHNTYVIPECDTYILDIPAISAEFLAQYWAKQILLTWSCLSSVTVHVSETNKMVATATVR